MSDLNRDRDRLDRNRLLGIETGRWRHVIRCRRQTVTWVIEERPKVGSAREWVRADRPGVGGFASLVSALSIAYRL